MENLRQMLFPYSKDMPVYFSCRVNNYDQEVCIIIIFLNDFYNFNHIIKSFSQIH